MNFLTNKLRSVILILGAAGAPLTAALPELPVPLKLPPTLRETLIINPNASHIGDAVRIIDCPEDADLPFGACENQLFGGLAMWDTPLSGAVDIQFYAPINNIAHFVLRHPGNLYGPDTTIQAPQNYKKSVRETAILDALDKVSSGDLNLLTGEVTNYTLRLLVSNTWYADLVKVNPNLKPPDFTFPGIYGSAQMIFTQRADGLLDVSFQGSTFLPLGRDTLGDPVRMPLAYAGPGAQPFGITASGSSLHPHIYYTTRAYNPEPCGDNCASITPNSTHLFTAHSYYTSFGDHFNIIIPQLGGRAAGRTHLQGRFQVQYGPRNGNKISFAVTALPAGGLLADLPSAPPPLSTFPIKMLGHDEFFSFPSGLIYTTRGTVFLEDGFDPAVGWLDLTTGRTVEPMLYRGVPAQDLFSAIILLNITRIPLDTFRNRGDAYVLKGRNGQTIFGFNGLYVTDFSTFSFPGTDYTKPFEARSAQQGSILEPFWRMQGAENLTGGGGIMSGSAERLTSSFREPFSYSYSVPCDPGFGAGGQMDYTNFGQSTSGGSFHMEQLAYVSCTNSKFSNSPPGTYDTISFGGYGTWSRDVNDGRHIITVHASRQPGTPFYISIQVDGGLISKVHLKPPEDTIP